MLDTAKVGVVKPLSTFSNGNYFSGHSSGELSLMMKLLKVCPEQLVKPEQVGCAVNWVGGAIACELSDMMPCITFLLLCIDLIETATACILHRGEHGLDIPIHILVG
jgi:hypothetical protein